MSFIFFIIYILFVFTQPLTRPIINDVAKNFITLLFPSLFTSLVFIDIFKDSKIINYISAKLFPLFNKLFNINYPKTVSILLLSFFCGAPGNSKLIIEALNSKEINKKEAKLILPITSLMSLSYVITITSLYSNNPISIILSYYFAHIIVFFIKTRFYKRNKQNSKVKHVESDLENIFLNSIEKNMNILLKIFGIMVFVSSITAIILTFYPSFKEISFILEINTGITLMNKYPHLIITALSVLGISILLQIKSLYPTLDFFDLIKNKLTITLIANLLLVYFSNKEYFNLHKNLYVIPIAFLIFILIFSILIKPKKTTSSY